MRNMLEKLMCTSPATEPEMELFITTQFYYYVRRNDGHGTVVESVEELDLGSEICVDVNGAAQFYVVMQAYIPYDAKEASHTYKMHPAPEKAIVARDRAEARLKVQRDLDRRIDELERRRRYEHAAEIDEISAGLYDKLLELTE